VASLKLLAPASLTLSESIAFCKSLAEIDEHDEYVFDFSRTGTVEPFPMLLVASEINHLNRRHPAARVACSNFRHMTYAAHMGFFRAFGLDFGNAPGAARGSESYLPMTILSCEELTGAAAERGVEVGEEVESQSRHLAAMLSGDNQGPLFETLAYSLRELMRNVVEHSKANVFGICAQHWPSKQKVEVAILDRGIGVRSSLSHNPHLDASDDKRALNYALMPAVSGKAFKGSRVKQRGHWANSGFGLYMTSRICRTGGTFFISSGEVGMLLTKASEAKRYFECALGGTAIRMVMRTNQVDDLNATLERFRNEGYEIQKRYKEIVDIDPSSASLMLSTDFDLGVWDKVLAKLRGVAGR
jgi:hypothetical protein